MARARGCAPERTRPPSRGSGRPALAAVRACARAQAGATPRASPMTARRRRRDRSSAASTSRTRRSTARSSRRQPLERGPLAPAPHARAARRSGHEARQVAGQPTIHRHRVRERSRDRARAAIGLGGVRRGVPASRARRLLDREQSVRSSAAPRSSRGLERARQPDVPAVGGGRRARGARGGAARGRAGARATSARAGGSLGRIGTGVAVERAEEAARAAAAPAPSGEHRARAAAAARATRDRAPPTAAIRAPSISRPSGSPCGALQQRRRSRRGRRRAARGRR